MRSIGDPWFLREDANQWQHGDSVLVRRSDGISSESDHGIVDVDHRVDVFANQVSLCVNTLSGEDRNDAERIRGTLLGEFLVDFLRNQRIVLNRHNMTQVIPLEVWRNAGFRAPSINGVLSLGPTHLQYVNGDGASPRFLSAVDCVINREFATSSNSLTGTGFCFRTTLFRNGDIVEVIFSAQQSFTAPSK